MISNYEIIQKAKAHYEELGGIRSVTARLLRGLWEKLETSEEKVKQLSELIKKYDADEIVKIKEDYYSLEQSYKTGRG